MEKGDGGGLHKKELESVAGEPDATLLFALRAERAPATLASETYVSPSQTPEAIPASVPPAAVACIVDTAAPFCLDRSSVRGDTETCCASNAE